MPWIETVYCYNIIEFFGNLIILLKFERTQNWETGCSIAEAIPMAFLYASIAADVFFLSMNSCPISVHADVYCGFSLSARWK